RQRVEQRALAGVRVADERDHRGRTGYAPPPLLGALLGELLQLALEASDPLACAPAANLELRLARTSATDPAGETAQRVVPRAEPRQRVLQLRQLHLQLAVRALRALREDVQDELRSVDDLQIRPRRNAARLRRAQLLVEDQRLCVEIDGAEDHLLQLAAAQ